MYVSSKLLLNTLRTLAFIQINMAESNNNSSTNQPVTNVSARLVWPALKKATGTGAQNVFPFLSPDNDMDRALICVLLVERPYKAQYGSGQESWERCTQNLKEQKDGNGESIFCNDISVKALKERFKKYISFVKDKFSSTAFCSGCDDEAEPGEVISGFEDLHEDYTSFVDTSNNNEQTATAQKQQNRADATAIKNAAAFGFNRKRHNNNSTRDSGSVSDIDNGSLSSPSKKSRRSTGQSIASAQSILGSLQEVTIFKSHRQERERAKALRKEEKQKQKTMELQIQQQRLDLEEKVYLQKSMELQLQQQKFNLEEKLQLQKLELERERSKVEQSERQSNAQLIASVANLLTVQVQAQSQQSQSSTELLSQGESDIISKTN